MHYVHVLIPSVSVSLRSPCGVFAGGGGGAGGRHIVKALRPGQAVPATPVRPGGGSQAMSPQVSHTEGAAAVGGLKSPGGLAPRSLRGEMPVSAALSSSFSLSSSSGSQDSGRASSTSSAAQVSNGSVLTSGVSASSTSSTPPPAAAAAFAFGAPGASSSTARQEPVGVEQPSHSARSDGRRAHLPVERTASSSSTGSPSSHRRRSDKPATAAALETTVIDGLPPPPADERRSRRSGRSRKPKNYAAPDEVVVVDTAHQTAPEQV